MTLSIESLQSRAVTWHKQRFPNAELAHVGLKLCEESGEVASAINGLVGTASATGKGDVLDESADVLISLMVILGRWRFDSFESLCDAAERKLDILLTPGAHPASIS